MIHRQVFGTPRLLIDLVDPNIHVKANLNTRAVQPLFTFPHPDKGGTFAQVKILGSILELDFITRNNEVG